MPRSVDARERREMGQHLPNLEGRYAERHGEEIHGEKRPQHNGRQNSDVENGAAEGLIMGRVHATTGNHEEQQECISKMDAVDIAREKCHGQQQAGGRNQGDADGLPENNRKQWISKERDFENIGAGAARFGPQRKAEEPFKGQHPASECHAEKNGTGRRCG